MEKKKSGMATASMVLGIVGLCIAFIPLLGYAAVLLGLLASVFGVVSLCRKAGVGKAIAGLVLGLIALVYAVVSIAALGKAVDDINDAVDDLNNSLSDMSGDNTEELLKSSLDVVLGDFSIEEGSFLTDTELLVTLTNKSGEAKSFSVQIEAIDANGSRITTDTVYVSNLNAGQSQECTAFTLVTSDTVEKLKTATFRVQSVSAY